MVGYPLYPQPYAQQRGDINAHYKIYTHNPQESK